MSLFSYPPRPTHHFSSRLFLEENTLKIIGPNSKERNIVRFYVLYVKIMYVHIYVHTHMQSVCLSGFQVFLISVTRGMFADFEFGKFKYTHFQLSLCISGVV